jgi:hypothetical protein
MLCAVALHSRSHHHPTARIYHLSACSAEVLDHVRCHITPSRGADDAQTGTVCAAEQAHGPGGEGVQEQDGAVGRELHGSRYWADQRIQRPQVDVPEHPREVSSRGCYLLVLMAPSHYHPHMLKRTHMLKPGIAPTYAHLHIHSRRHVTSGCLSVRHVQEQGADAAAGRHAGEEGAAKQGLHRRDARGARQLPRPVRLARTSLFACLVAGL